MNAQGKNSSKEPDECASHECFRTNWHPDGAHWLMDCGGKLLEQRKTIEHAMG